MKNHEGDRHVLAAAVRCKAHCIITHNQKHFQEEHLAPYDVECLPLDDFLVHQYHIDPDTFISVFDLNRQKELRDLSMTFSPGCPCMLRN